MRIISGNHRGKKILQPEDRNTRPLKDLTKESIFNIIKHSNLLNIKIEKSNILDLFSGVGSFGLESLSRGASYVTFFENYAGVLPLLKKNIIKLNYQNESEIIEKSIFDEDTLTITSKKIDIIFIDPPYKEKNLHKLLEKIIKLKLLKKNGIFIIHRHKKENNEFPKKFKIIKTVSYGVSKIIFGSGS